MRTANLSRAFTAYTLFSLLFFGFGCDSLKVGESWKMLPEDQTFGLTLLWELPEAKLKAMLPADQQPRIRNGKGVVMLFLASSAQYTLGDNPSGPLAVAHLLIPLDKHLGTPSTVVSKYKRFMAPLHNWISLFKMGRWPEPSFQTRILFK